MRNVVFNQKPLSDSADNPASAAIGGMVDIASDILGTLIGANTSKPK